MQRLNYKTVELRFIIGFLITLLLLSFGGCKTSQSGNVSQKPLKIAIVTNNSSDWWTIAKKGGDKAARETPGITLDFRMLAEGTAAAQKSVVDDLLAGGVDALAVSPLDVVNQKPMLDAAASKTVLFTLGADAPTANRVAYVGTDDIESGKAAAEMVKAALPSGGKIMVFVGRRDTQNAMDRLGGLQQGLQGSGIEIIDVRTDDADTLKAKANVADTLVKYPDVVGLIGLWSYNGPAILNAVREAGKLDKIKIVCFDEEDQTLQGVQDGHIYATVVQQPFQFTYEAVKRMALYLRGDKSQIPANGKIIYPTAVIRADNVAHFREELKQLRGH